MYYYNGNKMYNLRQTTCNSTPHIVKCVAAQSGILNPTYRVITQQATLTNILRRAQHWTMEIRKVSYRNTSFYEW